MRRATAVLGEAELDKASMVQVIVKIMNCENYII